MKRNLQLSKPDNKGWLKIITADLICFLLVTLFSFGFCYSFFSDSVSIDGNSRLGSVNIDYRTNASDPTTSTNLVQAKINGGASAAITSSTKLLPGDSIVITGYAVNTSNIDVYVLGRLEITAKDSDGETIDTETLWYNISNNKVLYVQRGLFQVGASALAVGANQVLSVPYTIEAEKYTSECANVEIDFKLLAHQKNYLGADDDYSNYSAANGYTKDSILASHYITGRRRDVWKASDANVDGKTMADLSTDASGAYLINSCNDWMIFRANSTSSNSYLYNKIIKLNAYLDFNGNTSDKYVETFRGVLDGQGYTISNYSGTKGLFCTLEVNGVIRNFGIDGLSISSTTDVTGVDAWIGGICHQAATCTIENCFVIGASVYDSSIQNDIVLNTSEVDIRVGGLVGNLRGDNTSSEPTGFVKNCYTILNISVSGGTSSSCVGGVVGYFYTPYVSVDNCYFEGKIFNTMSIVANDRTGLIVGFSSNYGDINNCFGIITDMTTRVTSWISGAYNPDRCPATNCAYINNISSINNTVIKFGINQTDRNLTLDTFKSCGAMNKAFGWNTAIWGTEKYQGTSSNTGGKVILRVFYNF